MMKIVDIVNGDSHKSALNGVIDDAGCQDKSEIIRELWQKDVQRVSRLQMVRGENLGGGEKRERE